MNVLIVEDDPVQRLMLADILAAQGYTVQSAMNRQEALVQMRLNLPDIVITDWIMPPFEGGANLVTEMRARPDWANIPVIVSTALSEGPEVQLPIVRVFRKPWTEESFAEMLQLLTQLQGAVA